MSDARCPCDCESPCVLNASLDKVESNLETLKAELDKFKAYARSMEDILKRVGVSESLINEGRTLFTK